MRSALALLLLAPLASADVLVVSQSGPYTQIQDAVNAANEGDLVLVSGVNAYSAFHIQAKSLSVVGDPQGFVQGTVTVSDLAPGQTVELVNLRASGPIVPSMAQRVGLYSNNNQGSVRCQGCNFTGSNHGDSSIPNGAYGVWIANSSDVSLVSCNLRGGDGIGETAQGNASQAGHGAFCQSSTVTIFDSMIIGGSGEEALFANSGHGGAGLRASSCTIFSSNSTMQGGAGGGSTNAPLPGDGGPGAQLSSSLMRVLSCVLDGGPNGDFVLTGQSAPDTVGTTFNFLAGSARRLTVGPNPLREYNSVNLSFHGAPGEQVYLLVGLDTAVQWDPVRLANFLIAPPHYRTLFVGTTNTSGDLNLSLWFGDLGGTTQSRNYFLQPLFSGAGGAQQLGTPVTLAVLDQAF